MDFTKLILRDLQTLHFQWRNLVGCEKVAQQSELDALCVARWVLVFGCQKRRILRLNNKVLTCGTGLTTTNHCLFPNLLEELVAPSFEAICSFFRAPADADTSLAVETKTICLARHGGFVALKWLLLGLERVGHVRAQHGCSELHVAAKDTASQNELTVLCDNFVCLVLLKTTIQIATEDVSERSRKRDKAIGVVEVDNLDLHESLHSRRSKHFACCFSCSGTLEEIRLLAVVRRADTGRRLE
mmetsp:Transcript_15992/g.23622  ORF Transcript_15992/g.23622 Transcript_15992/m.23622 type:complete len:243 (+) Transcript_15992:758-1486(+)